MKEIREVQRDHQQKEDQRAGGRTSSRTEKTHGHDSSRGTRAIGRVKETRGEKVTVQRQPKEEVIPQTELKTRTIVQQQGVQRNSEQFQQSNQQQLRKKR